MNRKVPPTQVGSDRSRQSTQNKEPPSSSPLFCINSMNASVTQECLPPVAERETRNLHNFFPFPHLLKEEEALESKEEEPLPDEVPYDWEFDHMADCLLQANWVNRSFSVETFPLLVHRDCFLNHLIAKDKTQPLHYPL